MFLLISVAFNVNDVEAIIVIVIIIATINGKLVYITTKHPNISIHTLSWRPCAFHIISFHLFSILCDRFRRRKCIRAPVIWCESIACLRARAAWARFGHNHISDRVQLSRLAAREKTNQNSRERGKKPNRRRGKNKVWKSSTTSSCTHTQLRKRERESTHRKPPTNLLACRNERDLERH